MARILITGSSTGLGLLAGKELARRGHAVFFHARDETRAEAIRSVFAAPVDVLVGDLQTIRGCVDIAERANGLGRFDAVIHNAGVYRGASRRTVDGFPAIFAVNALAPYILTSLMIPSERLVYLSSNMHCGADAHLEDVLWRNRRWDETAAYSESKLHVLLLAFAVARLRRGTFANAVDPGWVPTRMGGSGAPDDLPAGYATQVELAAPASSGALANANGAYLRHGKPVEPDPQSRDIALQGRFLELCNRLSGVELKPL